MTYIAISEQKKGEVFWGELYPSALGCFGARIINELLLLLFSFFFSTPFLSCQMSPDLIKISACSYLFSIDWKRVAG